MNQVIDSAQSVKNDEPLLENEEASPGDERPADQPVGPTLDADCEAELKRIKDLPPEVGVMLLTVGALGLVMPGVVGAPAVIAGGLVLWPRRFERIENWFERRFPAVHRKSLQQIHRYLDDLEARYPSDGMP